MENFKLIQFDLKRAKTPSNPEGLEVVMKSGKDARIICTDKSSRGYPIVALVTTSEGNEDLYVCDVNGQTFSGFDSMFLKEPLTPRRMTNLELSRWLRDCTEEHREFKNSSNTVFSVYNYFENSANEPVGIDVMIRANDGEWREPLIEIEDYEL